MMVGLLLHAHCVGVFSSRKIEKAYYHSVPFRVLTADQNPDHNTDADFRKRHLKALSALFAEVLQLCEKTGVFFKLYLTLRTSGGSMTQWNLSRH